jgi:hypothetical protein
MEDKKNYVYFKFGVESSYGCLVIVRTLVDSNISHIKLI